MVSDAAPSPAQDARLDKARGWLSRVSAVNDANLIPVAGDASFRRYFRVTSKSSSWVLMDAPPAKEDSRPFLDVSSRLRSAGIRAPAIVARDTDLGFILLEDFGDTLLRDALDERSASAWFPRLLALLAKLSQEVETEGLPHYDRKLLTQELELFTRWYLDRHHEIKLDCDDLETWESMCTLLLESAAEQPRVFVHRDFHSCNLMVLPTGDLGLIDFQDAVLGPLSYDFASLAWDRYITWSREQLLEWMIGYRDQVSPATDEQTWIRWCDWMGLQRNLKIVGIFSRLNYRDGKTEYLEMIPRFWEYIVDVLPRYPELGAFEAMLERLRCAP
ncbi:MAG: phosphotransferase [Xanthomonadales bacterium]|nr:phosphotransferase [Xanthomonadales bacterium]